MKKYIVSIIAMVLSALSVCAQTISFADASINIQAGETQVVSIFLDNTQPNIVSFQMDLTLPDGITLDKSGCELSNRFTDSSQNLTIGKQPNGDYRLTSTSLSLKPISGYSGEIIKLSLVASKSAKGGTASIQNIKFSTSYSERLTSANVTFMVDVSYILTYQVDGAEYKTSTLVYGTPITPEAELTKEGYTFSGWSEIPGTMPNHDVIVSGYFTINSYTLTYKVNDEVYKTYTIDYGTVITPEEEPTKEGHTFSGWSEIPGTMPAHEVEVNGSFTINSYTLTYKVDGIEYKTSTVVYGTAITPEANPTKEGYTFSGWSEIPTTMPAHDVEVTGEFTINSYMLTYLVDGEVYKTSSVVYGTAITPEVEPTKEGYTFSGWSEIPATMPNHDVEVAGTFSINSYSFTYLVDGEVYKTSIVEYGTTITPEEAPTKEGHTFSGWSEIPTTMPAHDVEVTGSFSVNSYSLTYVVDGEVYKSSTIAYGTPITPEAEPTKEGYTFSGWSEIPATMPAHDVTVTGQHTINTHTLKYLLNGITYKEYTLDYHQAITPEPDPIKEGYTFSGWSEIPEMMPDHDVEVTGTLTINSYTLTYMVDGGVYKISTVQYGTSITPEAEPTKEGYTFSGWSEIPATMPANDIEVTGTFTINSYMLTYLLDGEVYKSTSIEYGTTLIPEAAPTKAGYTFSGWSEIPETMPAHDVEVKGSFIAILATRITLDKDILTFNTIAPQTLNATITPEDVLNKTVAWISTNPDVVTVNEEGVVTPVYNGEALVIASTMDGSDLKDTCRVVVNLEDTPIPAMNNVIYMDKTEGYVGQELTLSFQMKNTADICSFQFDLYLPDGVTVLKSPKGRILGALNEGRLPEDDEHTLTISEQADGAIRLFCSSQYEETFTWNDGEIATLQVMIGEDVEDGEYPVIIKNMKLTEIDISKTYETSSLISTLIVYSHMMGDVNDDLEVDVSDYTGVANHIIGKEQEGFITNAADVDHNGTIDIADYKGIANIIMTGNVYGNTNNVKQESERTKVTDLSGIENVIYVQQDEMIIDDAPNAEVELSIQMKNAADIRGFQFDLYLPQGWTVMKNSKGRIIASLNPERLPEEDEHELMVAEQADGAIRFLCSSTYDETFTGTEGEIATLKVKLAEDVTIGDCLILQTNMKLTETDISKFYKTELIETTFRITHNPDLNHDGRVDIADAVSVLNVMAGGSESLDADLNSDGRVDIADFVSILNIMATR